jgi:hypothetical protein
LPVQTGHNLLMQEATRDYVNMPDRLTQAVVGLYVPNVKTLDENRPSCVGWL